MLDNPIELYDHKDWISDLTNKNTFLDQAGLRFGFSASIFGDVGVITHPGVNVQDCIEYDTPCVIVYFGQHKSFATNCAMHGYINGSTVQYYDRGSDVEGLSQVIATNDEAESEALWQ